MPQELPKVPSGGEGATVLSVTLYPNYHHLAHKHPPPGPCCMYELLGWFHSGGLVIKQVTISPTGLRCFKSLQGACNLSLITHLTINRQTVRHPPYGVMLWSPQTSKHYPHIGPWNKLTEGDHRLHPTVQNVILVSRSEVTPWRNGFNCSH